MPALIRQIYRGWERFQSFWDTVGMDENLRTIGDHLPLNIMFITGPKPETAEEGDCWIEPSTGAYAVWSTGPKLEPATWNIYPPRKSIIGAHVASDSVYYNTGSSWKKIAANPPDAFDD